MSDILTENLHEATCPTHGKQYFTLGLQENDITNNAIDKCTYEGCNKPLIKIKRIKTEYNKKEKKIIKKEEIPL